MLAGSVIWDLLGGMFGLIRLVIGAGIAFALFWSWNTIIDNPRVTEAARREYVAIAQLEAERAKAAELERQRNAASQAFEEYRRKLDAALKQEAIEDTKHEQEIAAYEKLVAAAGRACVLDDSDIEFLLKP